MSSNEQLFAFIEVYELGSYSAASRRLQKGRTTIRELIMTLEDDLNLSLFDIVGRTAKPTIEADNLYSHAKALQEHLFKFKSLASSMSDQQELKLVIAYDPMLPSEMMIELTLLIHKHHPHIELQWLQSSRQDAMDDIANKSIGLAIFPTKKSKCLGCNVSSGFLGQLPFGLYCRPGSHLAAFEQTDKQIFREEIQVINRNMTLANLNDYFCFSADHIIVNDFELVCQFLVKTGWGIVPLHCAEKYIKQGSLKQIQAVLIHNDLQLSMSYYFQAKIKHSPVMTTIFNKIDPIAKTYFL